MSMFKEPSKSRRKKRTYNYELNVIRAKADRIAKAFDYHEIEDIIMSVYGIDSGTAESKHVAEVVDNVQWFVNILSTLDEGVNPYKLQYDLIKYYNTPEGRLLYNIFKLVVLDINPFVAKNLIYGMLLYSVKDVDERKLLKINAELVDKYCSLYRNSGAYRYAKMHLW